MTAPPFVFNVRSRRDVVMLGSPLGSPDGRALNLRVEMPDVWDVVRLVAPPSTRARDVKVAALGALVPSAAAADYAMKLRGIEVLDEGQTLEEAGAIDGSIFVLMYRRRRPVR